MTVSAPTSTGPLEQVLVCPPSACGWDDPLVAGTWEARGFLQSPDAARAESEHAALVSLLRRAGARVDGLRTPPADLDTVYVHDASFATPAGVILLRPGKTNRRAEPEAHARTLDALGLPVCGAIESPGTVEGGDLVWLDPTTVLAGRSHRTNAEGIAQLGRLLAEQGIAVESVPLPHAGGPDECLHLMSLVSPLDPATWLVDRPWLTVETLERLAAVVDLVDIHPDERSTLAANVLPLGNRELVLLTGNPHTRERLRARGFRIHEVEGTHVGVHGTGGPTCLTRPLRRAAD